MIMMLMMVMMIVSMVIKLAVIPSFMFIGTNSAFIGDVVMSADVGRQMVSCAHQQ